MADSLVSQQIKGYFQFPDETESLLFNPSGSLISAGYGSSPNGFSNIVVEVRTGRTISAYIAGSPLRWLDDERILTIWGIYRVADLKKQQ